MTARGKIPEVSFTKLGTRQSEDDANKFGFLITYFEERFQLLGLVFIFYRKL